MDIMEIALWVIIAYLLIFLIQIVKGPTIWDRLLGFNLVSTKIITIIVIFASITGTSYLLDFAIIYALFGFIGEIFIALFLAENAKEGEEE